ncbi:MAG: 50S ribosomal protein L9, partial [Patescibacteria group bacterium]
MKIILLKDIAKVGKKYETKDISDGYAINLLIPKGLAVPATSEMLKKISLERSLIDGEKKIHDELLHKNMLALDGITVSIVEKANEKGHLFAGVHVIENVKAILKQTRIQIPSEL